MVKYAHIGDSHIGGWADPKMRNLNSIAFVNAIDICIIAKVDFILLTGDLFNSALPPIDSLKMTVKKLRDVKNNKIPVYIIPGSHDFSPSGKTMIDILCEAGLCENVVKGNIQENKLKLKFTTDPKTGIKITGILGKRGTLEKSYYESLDNTEIEQEPGYKIFMFHSALTELKPKSMENMESISISTFPKNFDYYAGGHVHVVKEAEFEGYKKVVYPGPLFPNNFKEIEKLGNGGFFIIEDDKTKYIPIKIYDTYNILINCDDKTIENVKQELFLKISEQKFIDTIVLIRLEGMLSSGKHTDINFKEIFNLIYKKGAYFVMKNTVALTSKELKEFKIDIKSTEDLELTLIKEHVGQFKNIDKIEEEKLIKELMISLKNEKDEGEKVYDFESRIIKDVDKIFGK